VPVHDVPVDSAGELLPQPASGHAFEAVHQPGRRHFGWVLDQQVDVVMFPVEFDQVGAEVGADVPHHLFAACQHRIVEHVPPILGYEDQVCVKVRDHMSTAPVVAVVGHETNDMLRGVELRYNYRLYPSPGQRQSLARAFGCARAVFNDGLRARQEAHASGLPYIRDADLQKRVITAAKRTPQRAWLAEVSSVVLVQALNDLHVAYRNFFNSVTGRRKGRRVAPPRFRSRKDHRQAIRLARNGFSLRTNGRLYVAKVGEVEVRWSRDLPSAPSSVTVIADAAGRYWASFVVQATGEPLPASESEVGIDLGLTHFAVLSNGTKVTAPKFLRRAERRLRRAQQALSRKAKGSANRGKARVRVARQHAHVAAARRDFHHKLSTTIVRDNQAVYVEDLCVVGLGRTRLAKSVHDAGWAQFVNMLAYKAARWGRTYAKIDRFAPTSQTCSACGRKDGPKPLNVREWTCPCGATHDRDVNAAINILAAGRADKSNACGDDVRPGLAPAVVCEAGTHRRAA
jgi:putative transposase